MHDLIKDLVIKRGIGNIMFEDDNFLLFKKRNMELFRKLKYNRISFFWSCTSRADTVDEDTIKMAKMNGCKQIMLGIESGSESVLEKLNKRTSLNQINKALEIIRENRIYAKGFFMFGCPGESKQTLKSSIKYIKTAILEDISITHFTPYPGTAIYSNINQYGELSKSFKDMTCFESVFIPLGLMQSDIYKAIKKAYLYFYLRPSVIFSYFRRVVSLEAAILYVRAFFGMGVYFFNRKKEEHIDS